MTKDVYIVTRDSLAALVLRKDKVGEIALGRALVVLFNRQTTDEQRSDDTRVWNERGFTGADARSGSLTAKFFLKNGYLLDWQREKWLKLAKNGYPRIAKYWRQLNEVAKEKANVRNS